MIKPGIAGFSDRLKSARQMRRMTQVELSKATGLTSMHISHFECGRRLPHAKNLVALCRALQQSADYLLDVNGYASSVDRLRRKEMNLR